MYCRSLLLLASLQLSSVLLADAGNPIAPLAGMADTNVHYFNGSFVIFATHDFSINNTGFLMKDWQCWTSQDLVQWEVASTVNPIQVLSWSKGEENECWATDGAFRNGLYYFYLSVGGSQVGVVTADSIRGPWTDPLGKPLLSIEDGKALGTTFRDPAVFEDDDGEWYIIAGVFKYFIAKLTHDMVALAEPLRHVQVNNPYGPCGNGTTDDKPFLHKNNGLYYLSWGCFYGISKSIYGPYDTKGSVIDTAKIVPAFQMNNSKPQPVPVGPSTDWFRGEDYTDRHGSFLQHGKQWYYASNDRSHSGDKGHEGYFRDTVMCYVHFRADGTMEPCVIDGNGVGTYDVSNGQHVEAENFFELTGNGEKADLKAVYDQSSSGFGVKLQHGSQLRFPHVLGTPRTRTNATVLSMQLHLRGGSGAGVITVRGHDGMSKGTLLSRCVVHMPADTKVTCPMQALQQPQLETELTFTFSALERGMASDVESTFVYFDSFQVVESDPKTWITV